MSYNILNNRICQLDADFRRLSNRLDHCQPREYPRVVNIDRSPEFPALSRKVSELEVRMNTQASRDTARIEMGKLRDSEISLEIDHLRQSLRDVIDDKASADELDATITKIHLAMAENHSLLESRIRECEGKVRDDDALSSTLERVRNKVDKLDRLCLNQQEAIDALLVQVDKLTGVMDGFTKIVNGKSRDSSVSRKLRKRRS